jgi:hypothetical protein
MPKKKVATKRRTDNWAERYTHMVRNTLPKTVSEIKEIIQNIDGEAFEKQLVAELRRATDDILAARRSVAEDRREAAYAAMEE